MEKRMALRTLRRGDPRDLVRLYEAQITILKQEFGKVGCKGCGAGFYNGKIKKYEDEIKSIKSEKRFRNVVFDAPKV